MQQFIITLLICSVTMSVLALFFMVVTPLLAKRYSAKGRYYAWLIIVVGLIIPFRLQFDQAIVKVEMPIATAPIIQIGNGVPSPIPIETVVTTSILPGVSLWQILAAIWLVGMIGYITYHIIKHIRFVKMAKRWRNEVANEETLAMFETLKREMKISKRIGLYFCPCVGSPTMLGFLSPYILLPKLDLAKDELRFILKHELVHYKRKDLWYKCLVLAATAVHWFNPVVYLSAKAINVLCEISCDTEVVYSTDIDTRQRYSETIIGVIRYQSKMQTALSTNFYGGKKGMKKRIFSIMDITRKKAGAMVLFAILACTVLTGMVVYASTNKEFTAYFDVGNKSTLTCEDIYNDNNLIVEAVNQMKIGAAADNFLWTNDSIPYYKFTDLQGMLFFYDITVAQDSDVMLSGICAVSGKYRLVAVANGKELIDISENRNGNLIVHCPVGTTRIAFIGVFATGEIKMNIPEQEGVKTKVIFYQR